MYINDKIKQVLTIKQLSPSQLADTIGIQRSSISHILSGRNRPSLDIIQKIVRCYPEFSYEWFLEENSSLPAPTRSDESFSSIHPIPSPYEEPTTNSRPKRDLAATASRQEVQINPINETIVPEKIVLPTEDKQIDRILIFYSDGTFSAYKPA